MSKLSFVHTLLPLLSGIVALPVWASVDAPVLSHIHTRALSTQAVQFVAEGAQRPLVMGYTDRPVDAAVAMPSNLQQWLRQVDEAAQFTARHPEFTLGTSVDTDTAEAVVVEPLLRNIMWDQGYPFDNFCPSGTPVGCVATAMAQVMYYWRYPDQGIGQHTWKYAGKTHNVDFGATTYDWDLMYDYYDGNTLHAQNEEVAKLSYHCGVALDMQYAADGSGTWNEYVPYALTTYFGYNPNCGIVYRTDLSFADWTATLNRELLAGRPIIFAGTSDQGGHAFVIDGVNAEGLYHVNWGWGGYYNGYYDICILNPSGVGTGAAISELGFCMDQSALVNVTPEQGCGEPVCPVRFDGLWFDRPATLSYYVMHCNNGRIKGTVGLEVTDADDRTISRVMTDSVSLGSVYNWGYYNFVYQDVNVDSLADGTYRLYPLFQADAPDASCFRMPTHQYPGSFRQIEVIDGCIASVQPFGIDFDIYASDFSLQGQQLAAGKPYVATIEITNHSHEAFNGTLALSPIDGRPGQLTIPVEGNRIYIDAGATTTACFPILIDEEGQYHYQLECYNRNVGYLSTCNVDTEIQFSVAFTEESPAHLTLSEQPVILTEHCVPDEEFAFQLTVNNLGGNFSDQLGLLFFGRSTSTSNPLVSITDQVEVLMQQTDLFVEIHTPLTGVKPMTKYYARAAYLNANGDYELMRIGSKLPSAIEVKVYSPSAIEQLPVDDADISAPLFDLYGRRADASHCGLLIQQGKVLFNK